MNEYLNLLSVLYYLKNLPLLKPSILSKQNIYNKYKKIREIYKADNVKLYLTEYNGEKYILKKLNKIKFLNIENEIKILQDIKNINGVQQFIETFELEKYIILIFKYCDGLDLFDYISNNQALSLDKVKEIIKNICIIIKNIHNKGIIHRDLKLENILIDEKFNITIIDWGLAYYKKDICNKKSCGSPNYAAPELFTNLDYNGPEIDVWSIGCIIYSLLTGNMAFDSLNIKHMVNNILSYNVNYNIYGLNDNSIDLLKKIFTDSKQRINIDNILIHPFLL